MTFDMNQDLERILQAIDGNRTLIREYRKKEDPEQVYETSYLTDQGQEEVTGNAQRIISHVAAANLMQASLAEHTGLNEATWNDFMGDNFDSLEDDRKEAIYKEALRYTNPEGVQGNEYAQATLMGLAIEDVLEKDDLEEQDIRWALELFQEDIQGSEIGSIIAGALQDYERNPNSVKALIAMKARVLALQKQNMDSESGYNLVKEYTGDKNSDYTRAAIIYGATV